MAIDLAVMRKRLEEKQAEIQQHIATLTGSLAPPQMPSKPVMTLKSGKKRQWISRKQTWIKLFWTMRKRCSPKYNRHWHASRMGHMVSVAIAGSQSLKNGWRLFPGPPCA